MLKITPFRLTAFLFFCLWAIYLPAQDRTARTTALSFLKENTSTLGLSPKDVEQIRITDEYISKNSGVTHVWFQQEYAGLPVYNALFGLHVLPSGDVKFTAHRFVAGLSDKVNTTLPSLTASQALGLAIRLLDIKDADLPRLTNKINEQNFIFDKGDISRADIPVYACYFPTEDGLQVRLVWMMDIAQVNTADNWSIRVDAQTGEILDVSNRTVYCKAGHAHQIGEMHCDDTAAPENITGAVAAEAYRVFALPTESPAHGPRTLVTAPANATASPYGWHDTNGAAGAEFTYTRGNNAWAYSDAANDNSGSVSESADGGAVLNFDFPFDPNGEPNENEDAAITNLFYINNMMHDILYLYGFDEVAGNFQANNYGRGGNGGDAVNAEALDGGGTDNANFATPADGSAPRMQMYRWSRSGGDVVTINAPAQVAGSYYGQTASGWGAEVTTVPVTGDVVLVNDGTGSPSLGCNPASNDINGKIAMVDRGGCEFGLKALLAEQAGAKACIICNFENSTVGMGPGAVGDQVTIPVVMMSKGSCDALKQFLNQGLNMTLVQPSITGPDFLDGDFDNGIIAHEYGHGVSNRLTGGPSQAGCLGNEEQMGEGWSDWFSLITSVKATDIAAQKRGVGTYVIREPNDGTGIRRYPYSTDMSINPITFGTVAQNTEVHAIGEIWTQVLWDLYWAMVDKYGFDADWTNTNSGNGRAIQLVMDGMKYQPCSPGFIDGRNAILLADQINYNNADTCLINLVFARRGMGLLANQGSSASASDGVEDFTPIETCIKELKIVKTTSTPVIDPNTAATFKITVTNHKEEAVNNVIVTDELPTGLTLITASNGGTVSGGAVTWDLGTLQPGAVVNLTYAADDNSGGSVRLYRDIMDGDDDWYTITTEGNSAFFLQNTIKKEGQSAWKVNNLDTETDMELIKASTVKIEGANPVFRFWNRYNTQAGLDAGFLEFQKEGEVSWKRVSKNKTFRNGYTGSVSYTTFVLPFLDGFSGNSNGWVDSYLDVSEFSGQDVFVKFRFGTDVSTGGDGWYVDDLELLDMKNYDGQACVTSAEGDNACANAPARGVIVNPGVTGTKDLKENTIGMTIQPNPASNLVYITMEQSLQGNAMLTLIGMDGRIAAQRKLVNINAGESVALDIFDLPAGVYSIRLEHASGVSVKKLVKQ